MVRWWMNLWYQGGALILLISANYPDHGHRGRFSYSRKNAHGRAGNRTRDLMISSQTLWPLDHEAGLTGICWWVFIYLIDNAVRSLRAHSAVSKPISPHNYKTAKNNKRKHRPVFCYSSQCGMRGWSRDSSVGIVIKLRARFIFISGIPVVSYKLQYYGIPFNCHQHK
jgi:hypothetical protein